ncbi:MAG: integrin alpha [Propionibacteriales bacterium]|nr:integrin alpha [Propionibacteriales bacterium]
MSVSKLATLTAILTLAAVGLIAPATPAQAAACDVASAAKGDINGDQQPDVVVGIPNRSSQAGAVDVRFDDDETPAVTITAASLGLGASLAGDRFGAAVLVDDINADGCSDLVIGAPGASSGNGAVYLAYGTSAGITSVGATRIASPASGARFGESVGVTHIADHQQLIVGAPSWDANAEFETGVISDVGTVFHATLSPTGTVGVWGQYSQGGVADDEAGDKFGAPLQTSGSWIMVGTPLEDVGTKKDAGQVSVIRLAWSVDHWYVEGTTTVNQNTAGAPGTAEKGDKFGASIALGSLLVAGAPGEDVGSKTDAGMVQRFELDGAGVPTFLPGLDQNSAGVPGTNEKNDQWGAAVAAGTDSYNAEDTVMMVGAPGEDIGSINSAGAVTILHGRTHLTGKVYRQGSGLPGGAEAGDKVGATLALLPDWNDALDDIMDGVVIGAPGENVGSVVDAGVVIYDKNFYRIGPWISTTFVGGAVKNLAYGASQVSYR